MRLVHSRDRPSSKDTGGGRHYGDGAMKEEMKEEVQEEGGNEVSDLLYLPRS